MPLVMSFAISWGAVAWVLISELFPMKARGVGSGISVMAMSAANLIVTLVFLILLDTIGIAMIFSIFAAICIISFSFVMMFVPETKNRSLEAIEKDLRQTSSDTSTVESHF